MALPTLLEIIPPSLPVRATLTVPGSKSITNRALILAALAHEPVDLRGALWSEDTQVMVECLTRLGFDIEVQPDPPESCNRRLLVRGRAGLIPHAGTAANPLELHVGNAGTAARFLAALVCLGRGYYRLDGTPRMRERPQGGLFAALRSLGHRVDAPADRLPAVIEARGAGPASCTVSIVDSSQFASALLLVAGTAPWHVNISGENPEESPYVAMTLSLRESFPHHGGEFQVEPDASSGSYFVAASHLFRSRWGTQASVTVLHWPESNWQIDAQFPSFLPLPQRVSRRHDLADSIMTAVVLAPLGPHPVLFTDLGRLRVQECERVQALRTELSRCGARVDESGDSLTVHPSALHAAEIETYQDHRIAMCFATLGLHVPGIKIKNPSCVAKTFPDFFAKLAAAPPQGLGIQCRDATTGRPLPADALQAS